MRRRLAVVAATLLFAAPALALDMPPRKAGLWEMKMVMEGGPMPAQAMRQCLDPATDKAMQAQYGAGGAAGATCSKQDFKTVAGVLTFESVCKMGPATTTTRGTVTGSFDSAYTMKIASRMAGGPPMPGVAPGGETRMTIEAKYLGPCQAGQKPGDIIMGNGMKINILDMPKLGGGMMPGR